MFQSRPGSPSHSGIPSPGPAPEFPAPAGFVYAPQMQGMQQPPTAGEDPFRVYVPAQHQGIINLNDEVPLMQNALQQGVNMLCPLSQEGRHFWWQIPPALPGQPLSPIQPPIPPVPIQPPAQIVAGVRHAAVSIGHTACQVHPQFENKLWCTKGRHWVESAIFGRLLTCEACRATD